MPAWSLFSLGAHNSTFIVRATNFIPCISNFNETKPCSSQETADTNSGSIDPDRLDVSHTPESGVRYEISKISINQSRRRLQASISASRSNLAILTFCMEAIHVFFSISCRGHVRNDVSAEAISGPAFQLSN